MICAELITWRKYQDLIIFEINFENSYIEISVYKKWIFNIEQINGGKYILFDNCLKKVFIV